MNLQVKAGRYDQRIREAIALVEARVAQRQDLPWLDEALAGFRGIVLVDETPTTFGWAWSAGCTIVLASRCFEPYGPEAIVRLPAVLLHELVHCIGGTELDAEAVENLFFGLEEGAVVPTDEDWAGFTQAGYQGRWLAVDPKTGSLMDRGQRPVGRFARPQSTGGSPMATKTKTAKKAAKPEKLKVHLTLEIDGKVKKEDLDKFATAIGGALSVHLENGSNGE